MGNCYRKLTTNIFPCNTIIPVTSSSPVTLFAPPSSDLAFYILFALHYKSISPLLSPPSSSSSSSPLILQIGRDTASGSPHALLRFIDSKFPIPPLLLLCSSPHSGHPAVVRAAFLQHHCILRHLDKLILWAHAIAARGGAPSGDPSLGTFRMEIRKFGRVYSQLLEVALEQAQMEERVVFPILETCDRGLCEGANREHAKRLPILNGIREDVKAIEVMESGNSSFEEALFNLLSRLQLLKEYCRENFEEEEDGILPLMKGVEMKVEEEWRVMENGMEVMEGTHSRLFSFFMEGLEPHQGMEYVDLLGQSKQRKRLPALLQTIMSS